MTIEHAIIGVLLAVIVHQQHFFLKQIQLLTDKIKASSFESYTRAKEPSPKLKVAESPLEDLGTLQEFTMQI